MVVEGVVLDSEVGAAVFAEGENRIFVAAFPPLVAGFPEDLWV
jgi:hypothetical protein